jgi:PAS domain S-box-containing protein
MRQWVNSRLGRTFAIALTAGLLSASLIFLVLFVGLYRNQLESERAMASEQVNLLFQAALENAMLKRDLDGLAGIVERLGRQDGVVRVMIVNPAGEVRFSSRPGELHRIFDPAKDQGCAACHGTNEPAGQRSLFLTDADGRDVLRAVNPVHNKEPCQQCHGPMDQHPINGVLLVDWDAGTLKASARGTALLLIGAGGAVVVIVVAGVWALLNRLVLRRLAVLGAASTSIGQGRLDVTVPVDGGDEIADLGLAFNTMVAGLKAKIREVAEREDFLQSLIDAVPDGIRVMDERGTIVKVNRAYRRQLGLADGAAVVGLCCHQSSHGSADPCPPTLVTCPLEVIGREGRPVKSVHRHVTASGAELEVEVYAAPLVVDEGGCRRTYMVESIRDLAADIRFGHEAKLAAVGQLAAGVAHEIRNPLASIRLALQAILREAGLRTGQADICNYLQLVDGQIDKCIDVTNRLLKLSGGPAESVQLVEVNAAIAETLSLVAFHADQLEIRVTTDFDGQEPRILGTEGDLRMLLLNLVQNAFHAMPDGGRLVVSTRQEGDCITILVRDTGVGIELSHQRRIFEPFFSHRADGETGTGLGLAICKSIVEALSGTISVTSEPGRGATFTVVLPTAQAAMDKAEREDKAIP